MMTYENRNQISKWHIVNQEVFEKARAACPSLPAASGDWLELHWHTHAEPLQLTESGGVTYGTKNRGNDFFFLEFEGEVFAEAWRDSAKNYVPQKFSRADGREYWQ